MFKKLSKNLVCAHMRANVVESEVGHLIESHKCESNLVHSRHKGWLMCLVMNMMLV